MSDDYDWDEILTKVEIIARRRCHPGHAMLDFQELVGEGNLVAVRVVQDSAHCDLSQEEMVNLVGRSFENHIISKRRFWALSKIRGSKTYPTTGLPVAGERSEDGEASELDPADEDALSIGEIVDARRRVQSIMSELSDEQRQTLTGMLAVELRSQKALGELLRVEERRARTRMESVVDAVADSSTWRSQFHGVQYRYVLNFNFKFRPYSNQWWILVAITTLLFEGNIQQIPRQTAIRANALGGSEVSGRDVCDLVYDLDDRTGTDRSKVGKFFGGVRYDIRCPICDGEVDFPPQEFDKETCRIHGRVKSETWDDRIKVTRKFVEALHAEE